jgi:2-phospho-L-lactate guanylyltransferase
MSNAAPTLALVPLNAAAIAKTRLRAALPDAERLALIRWLAARVLDAIASSRAVAGIAVVSPDPDMLAWARGLGAFPLLQREGGLNDGLDLGRQWALRAGAGALLVVLGDLPLLRPTEVAALVAAGGRAKGRHSAVLAPDREGHGTNALLQRPADLLPFAFGEGSFQRHRELTRAAGIEATIYRSLGTGFDVDMPADLGELRARQLWPAAPASAEGAVLEDGLEHERNAS